MFDAIEKAFDDVPSSIQHTAIAALGLSIRARRNNCLRTRGPDGVHEGIRVIAFVGSHGAHVQMFDQFVHKGNVRNLSFGGNYSQRSPGFIDSQVQLGRQLTARTPDRLRVAFFRALTECWCARMMVAWISTR